MCENLDEARVGLTEEEFFEKYEEPVNVPLENLNPESIYYNFCVLENFFQPEEEAKEVVEAKVSVS